MTNKIETMFIDKNYKYSNQSVGSMKVPDLIPGLIGGITTAATTMNFAPLANTMKGALEGLRFESKSGQSKTLLSRVVCYEEDMMMMVYRLNEFRENKAWKITSAVGFSEDKYKFEHMIGIYKFNDQKLWSLIRNNHKPLEVWKFIDKNAKAVMAQPKAKAKAKAKGSASQPFAVESSIRATEDIFNAQRTKVIMREDEYGEVLSYNGDFMTVLTARSGRQNIPNGKWNKLVEEALGDGEDDLDKVFELLDVDGDGVISTEEFAGVLMVVGGFKEKMAEKFVKTVDKNSNGIIELDELRAYLTNKDKIPKELAFLAREGTVVFLFDPPQGGDGDFESFMEKFGMFMERKMENLDNEFWDFNPRHIERLSTGDRYTPANFEQMEDDFDPSWNNEAFEIVMCKGMEDDDDDDDW